RQGPRHRPHRPRHARRQRHPDRVPRDAPRREPGDGEHIRGHTRRARSDPGSRPDGAAGVLLTDRSRSPVEARSPMSGARGIVAAVLLVSICAAAPALGQGGPRICIVSVENGTPTAADLGQGYRMAGRFIAFPGTSRPIIYPLNREGVWTIDESRAFVPYGGAFPVWRGSLWTKYAFEPLSKRIVAAHMRDVFVA